MRGMGRSRFKWLKVTLSALLVFALLPLQLPVANAALTENVYAFGEKEHGRLGDGGDGAAGNQLAPREIALFNNVSVAAVAAGRSHTLVLTGAGEVYAFGNSVNGKLGLGVVSGNQTEPAKIELPVGVTATAIAAGNEHSLILSSTGEVYAFGANNAGQLGTGASTGTIQLTPEKIETYLDAALDTVPSPTIIAIAAGELHSLVLSSTGHVYSFGAGNSGRLGHGNTSNQNRPVQIDNLSNIVAVAAGQYHSLVLTGAGQVLSFGNNFNGRLGLGDTTLRLEPAPITDWGGEPAPFITGISTGPTSPFSLAISSDGKVYSFGSEFVGHLGHGVNVEQQRPKLIEALADKTVTAVSTGASHSVVLTSGGEAYAFGWSGYGQLGIGVPDSRNVPVKIPNLLNARLVAAGAYHTILVASEDDGLEYSINLSATETEPIVFYHKHEGYENAPVAANVTVTNTGEGNITGLSASISGTHAGSFKIVDPPMAIMLTTSGETSETILRVRPQEGLTAGTHTATVTVTADKGVSQSFNVSFTVTADPTYSILVSKLGAPITETVVLPAQEEGYVHAGGYDFYISRTGTEDITNLSVTLTGDDADSFTLGSFSEDSRTLHDNQSSIGPILNRKTGLTLGTYTATVQITADNGISESFPVSFTVNSSPKIVSHPSNASVAPGGNATFAVQAEGTGTLDYQWKVDTGSGFVDLPDETDATLVIPNVTSSMNGYLYRVEVSGALPPPILSNIAELRVSYNPVYVPTPPAAGSQIDILVNGEPYNIGTATLSTVNGQTILTAVVNESKLEEELASEGDNAVVTVPIGNSADVVKIQLSGQIIDKLQSKNVILLVKTAKGTYTIPSGQINIDFISDQIGQQLSMEDIVIQIEIAAPTAETIQLVENTASLNGFELVAPPVNFSITAIYNGELLPISKFNIFVERAVAIPDGVDPAQITTGVIVDADGTARHVPTRVDQIDNVYYAVINSLTNSTYAVVWHPIEFGDVVNHWSESIVNDLGSRMVADGTGSGLFEPGREVTRAEFADMLIRGLGLKPEFGSAPFADVGASDWFGGAVHTAYSYGLMNGYDDGSFRPNDSITREQAMVVISKAMNITGLSAGLDLAARASVLNAYSDAASASAWAKDGIIDAVQAGIITGRSVSTLAPKAFVTRAEAAAIIRRLLQQSGLI